MEKDIFGIKIQGVLKDRGTVDVQKEKTAETAAFEKTRGRFFCLDKAHPRHYNGAGGVLICQGMPGNKAKAAFFMLC